MSEIKSDVSESLCDPFGLEPNAGHAAFEKLSFDDWHQWLVSFLSGEPQAPLLPVERDEPWHQFLIRVFDGLSAKAAVQFNQAVFKVFENTAIRKNNERQLYTLFHVMAYSVPGEAKELLRRRLREEVLRGLQYGHQDLHSLLLLTCSKFHVDESLVRYVQRSARSSKDFDYLLLCQWVLSTIEDAQAFRFNERLLPFIDSPELAAAASRQLASISERLGYGDFLAWYQSRSVQLEKLWEGKWELFVNSLRERLLSDRGLPILAAIDRDAALLYAELRITRDIIPPTTVLQIAQLHQALGIEETCAILSIIWQDLNERNGTSPWEYIGSKEKPGARSNSLGTIFQSIDDQYVELRVPVADDLATETVLIMVRNYCNRASKMRAARA